MKGESPCCGGGDTIIIEDKKLDGPVIGKKTVKISGMHCDHCVRAVTEAINKIDGVSAKVRPEKERSSRFLRKGCRRCSDTGSCRKGRIYRTEHSGLSYVKLQHCSACKNETGFLIAFQKKICYNNSVGSKEIWRSALFFIHDNRMLAERAFYCFNEGSADFDLQIFRGGKLRFEIQEVSKEGYAL